MDGEVDQFLLHTLFPHHIDHDLRLSFHHVTGELGSVFLVGDNLLRHHLRKPRIFCRKVDVKKTFGVGVVLEQS